MIPGYAQQGEESMSKNKLLVSALALGLALTSSASITSPALAKRFESTLSHKKLFKGRVNNNVSRGERYLTKGQYAKATEAFRKALNRNSRDTAALNGLGLSLAFQFKLDGAEKEFDKALKVDPNNALAHVGKAIVTRNRLQSSSNTIRKNRKALLQSAESDCKQALSIDPKMPEAHAILGLVYKEQGRLDEASSELKTALSQDKKYAFVLANLGIVELDRGNITDAQANLKKAIAMNSKNSTAHYGMGRVHLAQNNPDAALKELTTSLSLFRNSAPVHVAFGDAYAMQGNSVAAVKEYKEAIRIKPETTEAYMHLADIRQARGDAEFAIADLRSGIELNPDNPDLQSRVGELSLAVDKPDDAIKAFKAALDIDRGNARAVEGLTRAYYVKSQKDTAGAFFVSNDYESAERMIQEAIRLNPDNLQLRLADAKVRALSGKKIDLSQIGTPKNDAERIAYAEALLAQNKFDQATQQMAAVINNTRDAKSTFAVADLAVIIKDLDSAEAAYKKANTFPNSQERAERGLANCRKLRESALKDLRLAQDLAKKKQRMSAIDRYKKASFENPRLAPARLGLADTIRKLNPKDPGQLKEAADQYRAYLSLEKRLPEKKQRKIQKRIQKLEEKAWKYEQKRVAQGY